MVTQGLHTNIPSGWGFPSGCGFVPSLYREAELLKQLLSVLVDCLVLALATRVVETSLPTLATCEAGWWEVNLYTNVMVGSEPTNSLIG